MPGGMGVRGPGRRVPNRPLGAWLWLASDHELDRSRPVALDLIDIFEASDPNVLMVNPWDDNGLVDLGLYPLLAAYFMAHEGVLKDRHVGKKNPRNWHLTIDKANRWPPAPSRVHPTFSGHWPGLV